MADVKENDHAVVTVDIDAEADAVWESLTTNEGLADWFGDGSFVGDEPGDDLHVLDPVTGRPKSGIIEKIEPSECLEYTWWPIGAPDEASRVAITLVPCETGTRVTVTERPLLPTMTTITTAPTARSTICEPECALFASSGSEMWIEMAGAWAWRAAMLTAGFERGRRVPSRQISLGQAVPGQLVLHAGC